MGRKIGPLYFEKSPNDPISILGQGDGTLEETQKEAKSELHGKGGKWFIGEEIALPLSDNVKDCVSKGEKEKP